jgi:hypothetical protein
MFRKYEKTCRVPNAKIITSGKKMLSSDETRALLVGKIVIEEKIDGANVGIIGGKQGRDFRLQKRGSLVDVSEHPQYNRFKAWSMERFLDLSKITHPFIVYGEWMWATHHIYYDKLPDWFICFDIWNGEEYVNRTQKEEYCFRFHLQVVPLLFSGYVASINDVLPYVFGKSAYSSTENREGIQVKNYGKQMRGKIVNKQFQKELDEDDSHWTTHWDPRRVNNLATIFDPRKVKLA